jgi:hypothetical protein
MIKQSIPNTRRHRIDFWLHHCQWLELHYRRIWLISQPSFAEFRIHVYFHHCCQGRSSEWAEHDRTWTERGSWLKGAVAGVYRQVYISNITSAACTAQHPSHCVSNVISRYHTDRQQLAKRSGVECALRRISLGRCTPRRDADRSPTRTNRQPGPVASHTILAGFTFRKLGNIYIALQERLFAAFMFIFLPARIGQTRPVRITRFDH